MVAWKVIMFPLLVAAAGFMWILMTPMLTEFVPVINTYILSGMLSVQTVESINFGLTMFSWLPGIAIICFGIGLIVDAVWHGGTD